METLKKENFQVKKKVLEPMDRLSQLPDDILIHIMSFLSPDESYRTGLLSKSWRLHWLYAHPNFDFNTSAFIKPDDFKYPRRSSLDVPALVEFFFDRVNKVIRCCNLANDAMVQLNKLRIQFPLRLNEQHLKQIDEWISYAFARKVQSLELDLLPRSDPKILASYEPRLFSSGTEINTSSLRSLSLSGIQVTGKDIDSILFRCPFLEHLKVCRSLALVSIEFCSSSVALKHLELIYCDCLNYISVRDTNLISLTLSRVLTLVLENNPKLVYVCVSYWRGGYESTLQVLSSCLWRLQILTLNLVFDHDKVFNQVPQLNELKQLTLIAAPLQEDVVVRITTILRRTPNLEKLVLDLVKSKFVEKIEYKKDLKTHLQHLKDLEIYGYCGEKAEDELLRYVLEHVASPLERIVFYPHTSRCDHVLHKKRWKIKSVDSRIEQLKKVIPSPSSINIVTL